jgi:hypothetical protein
MQPTCRSSLLGGLLFLADFIVTWAFVAGSVHGETNSWINSGDGAWQDPTNWSLAQAPSVTHSIFITNDNSKTVQIDAITAADYSNTMAVTDVILSAPIGATNVLALSSTGTNSPLLIYNAFSIANGGSLLMTNSELVVGGLVSGLFSLDGTATLQDSILNVDTNNAIRIGDANSGILMVAGGTNIVSGDLYVGFATNSVGTLSVLAGQCTLTNGFAAFGFYGSGQALLSNSAIQVDSSKSAPNCIFVGLASGSQGYLSVAAGSSSASGHLALGDEAGSTGSVWISGGQLILTNGFLVTIGGSGFGQMVISNGQVLTYSVLVASGPASQGALAIAGGAGNFSGGLIVGGGQGATGTVSMTDGQLMVTNKQTILGSYGVGQMTASNGTFLAKGIILGSSPGSQGTLTISGGTVSITSSIVVGMSSNATGSVQMTGGNLTITNQAGTAQLVVGQIGRGAFSQSGGTVIVDQVSVANGTNSTFSFSSGVFSTKSTVFSNTQTFIVGDGSSAATFHLLGGVHSFVDNLEIRNNGILSGCGTINGSVIIDPGGTVLAECGGRLTFTGILTNNGILKAINGSVLESYSTVVNNGVIEIFDGNTNFHAGFINNGLVLDADSIPRVISIKTVGQDVQVRFTTINGLTYFLEARTNLVSDGWTPLIGFTSGGGNVTVIEPGAALLPQRFYRVRLEVPQ